MKKLIQDIKKNFSLIVLLAGLITSFYGLYMVFVLGFHSFDMAQNLIFIRDDVTIDTLRDDYHIDLTYFETKVSGEKISLEDTYAEGVGYLLNGIWITIFGIGMVGYAIGKLEK